MKITIFRYLIKEEEMKFWFKKDPTFDKLMILLVYLFAIGFVILVVLTILGVVKPPPSPY